jgi:hypothetical protein
MARDVLPTTAAGHGDREVSPVKRRAQSVGSEASAVKRRFENST